MHPEKLGFDDCDLTSIFKIIDKETQTSDASAVKKTETSSKSFKLPLPRELEKPDEGAIKVFSFCQIIQDPECPKSITIVRESVTEEVHAHDSPNNEAYSNRYRYCKEVIKPYLKDYPPDCPDAEDLLIRDAIISANEDFPEYPPCYEIPPPDSEKEPVDKGPSKKSDEDLNSIKSADESVFSKKSSKTYPPKTPDEYPEKKSDPYLSEKKDNSSVKSGGISSKKSSKSGSSTHKKTESPDKSDRCLGQKKSNKDLYSATSSYNTTLSKKSSKSELCTPEKSEPSLSEKQSDKDFSKKSDTTSKTSEKKDLPLTPDYSYKYYDRKEKRQLKLCPDQTEPKICIEITDPKVCSDLYPNLKKEDPHPRYKKESDCDCKPRQNTLSGDKKPYSEDKIPQEPSSKDKIPQKPSREDKSQTKDYHQNKEGLNYKRGEDTPKQGRCAYSEDFDHQEDPPEEESSPPHKQPFQVLPKPHKDYVPQEFDDECQQDFYSPELDSLEDEEECLDAKEEPPTKGQKDNSSWPPPNNRKDHPAASNNKIDHPAASNNKIDHPAASNNKIDHSAASNNKIDHPAASNNKKDHPAASNNKKDHPAASNNKKDHPAVSNNKKDHPAVSNNKKDCLGQLIESLKILSTEAETCSRKSDKVPDSPEQKRPKKGESPPKSPPKKPPEPPAHKTTGTAPKTMADHSSDCPPQLCKCKPVPATPPPPSAPIKNVNSSSKKCCRRRSQTHLDNNPNKNADESRPAKVDDLVKAKLVEVQASASQQACNCPTNVSSQSSIKGKSTMDAHHETLATLKCAMEDFMCKVFRSTQDAVTMITSESAKQLQKLKNSSSKTAKDCPPKPKRVSNSHSKHNLRRFSLVNVENPPQNIQQCTPEEPPKGPLKYVDAIVAKVDSAVSMISHFELPRPFKPKSFNDQSSKYDIPGPMRPKANDVENIINAAGPSTAFLTTITDKLWSMFCLEDSKPDNNDLRSGLSSTDTSTSATSESDEDLINKFID